MTTPNDVARLCDLITREFMRLANLAILRTDPLKFCSDCAHYNTPAGKEPCKDCLPRAAELPNYEAR